jgi:hypothetical protein
MALAHDHPAAVRRRKKAAEDKNARLKVVYDATKYSEPAARTCGCYACRFYSECVVNLYTLEFKPGEGWRPIPLRCFAEHPEFDPALWKMRG